ncbi:MAG: Type 1 glutamine amidotransferase-like domain-containing protein [Candidatus Eremiobacteraeota bacterium]|nr:Type 1 glutamine amidotransferase-like domain-containing protein [Candidatus Eremiobacteraeota bacterium]MCW5867395.1 Type 1 glutamine amidotransferase-like domain-containing protein [Candidatus Eremiobacteraeota bacterium]
MRGAVIFNGNIQAEADFVERAAQTLRSSRHSDPSVARAGKVVLVTAGWTANEYHEEHIKEALYGIGIEPNFQGGHDQNVKNLALYHRYQEFLEQRPALAASWQECAAMMEGARSQYLEKNSFFCASLRRSLQHLRDYLPNDSLADILDNTLLFSGGRGRLVSFLSNELREMLQLLQANDDRMVQLLTDLDEQFAEETGLAYDPLWMRLHQELSECILSANSLFLFGGNLGVLHRCLTFFRLRQPLLEALRRGTTFYTVSAGSLMCCERIIIYNDFEHEREFQLYDRGFGLIRELQLFPHCMDRIQTDDRDNLTYLSHRFRHRVCVGLNQESFLEVQFSPEVKATSLGTRDGVYVFDRNGNKARYNAGEVILPRYE